MSMLLLISRNFQFPLSRGRRHQIKNHVRRRSADGKNRRSASIWTNLCLAPRLVLSRISVQGSVLFRLILLFGSQSSSLLFGLFSDAIRWIVCKMENHIDIFVNCDWSWVEPQSKSLLPRNESHATALIWVGRCHIYWENRRSATPLTFLGIFLDSAKPTLRPPHKNTMRSWLDIVIKREKNLQHNRTTEPYRLTSLCGEIPTSRSSLHQADD